MKPTLRAAARFLVRVLSRFVAILIAVASVPGAIAFGAYVSTLVLSSLVFAAWTRRFTLAALCSVIAPIALVVEYQHRIADLSARYESGGARALSTRDRVSIYALNLEMAIVGAAIGFREAAFETALMAVGQRTVVDGDGTFLLEDPKIRRAVKSALADPRTTITLAAPHWRYDPKTESLRVGLAVNGAKRMTIVWHDDGETGELTLPIRITYPAEGKLVLVPSVFGRPLYIDEGLFHALEEVGWLTSYEMRWHTSVKADSV